MRLAPLLLLLVACGGSNATPRDSNADSGADAGAPTSGNDAPSAPDLGVARVVLHNATSGAITVFTDMYGKPLWLAISSLALNGYGGSWCDGSPHDDPGGRPTLLAPGATIEFDWNGTYVEYGTCYRDVTAPAATYPARACALEGDARDFNPTMPGADAGVPTLCDDFSLPLPANGESTIDVQLTAP